MGGHHCQQIGSFLRVKLCPPILTKPFTTLSSHIKILHTHVIHKVVVIILWSATPLGNDGFFDPFTQKMFNETEVGVQVLASTSMVNGKSTQNLVYNKGFVNFQVGEVFLFAILPSPVCFFSHSPTFFPLLSFLILLTPISDVPISLSRRFPVHSKKKCMQR